MLDNVYSWPEKLTEPKYHRLWKDGGVLGSFTKEISAFAGNYVEAKVFSDPNLMIYNPEEHQHGDSVGTDRRENVLQYIEEGTDFDFGGNAQFPRHFWGVIENMLNDGTLDSVFESLMAQNGINFIKS